MKKTLFVFSIFFFFQSALLALVQTNPDKVELVHLLMGDTRPVYTPVTGAILDGSGFECEVGDTIKFKAQTQPPEPAGDDKLYWSGTAPGCNGTGRSKTLTFANIGVFTVIVSLQSTVKTCMVYVNNNKASPIVVTKIKNLSVESCAHVGDESIDLQLIAEDKDYFWSYLQPANYVDFDKVTWKADSGICTPSSGEKTKWTPTAKGEAVITASTIDDKEDYSYSPRNDPSPYPSSVSITLTGFKVEVQVIVSTAGGNPPVVSVITEDGFEQGQPLPISSDVFNTTHEIHAASESSGTVDDPAVQSGAENISITWNYRTSPLGCKFRGTIQSTQSTIASGEFSVNAFDTDTDYATNGLIGWDPSVKLPLGFSINLSVFKPLLGYLFKQTEALAASTYAFDSPDLGQINPDTQRLEETSSKRSHWGSDYDADVQKNTALSPQPKIVAKGYGTDMDSKAIWQWFYKLDAISEPPTPINDDGIIIDVSSFGKARARGTVIIMTNCANVRYVR